MQQNMAGQHSTHGFDMTVVVPGEPEESIPLRPGEADPLDPADPIDPADPTHPAPETTTLQPVPQQGTPGLAFTGADVALLVTVALLLVVLGTWVVRRTRHHDQGGTP